MGAAGTRQSHADPSLVPVATTRPSGWKWLTLSTASVWCRGGPSTAEGGATPRQDWGATVGAGGTSGKGSVLWGSEDSATAVDHGGSLGPLKSSSPVQVVRLSGWAFGGRQSAPVTSGRRIARTSPPTGEDATPAARLGRPVVGPGCPRQSGRVPGGPRISSPRSAETRRKRSMSRGADWRRAVPSVWRADLGDQAGESARRGDDQTPTRAVAGRGHDVGRARGDDEVVHRGEHGLVPAGPDRELTVQHVKLLGIVPRGDAAGSACPGGTSLRRGRSGLRSPRGPRGPSGGC